MLEGLKKSWSDFKGSRPGRRFQERYERNRGEGAGWTRFLKPVAAALLIAAGVVFCVIPGPGLPLLVIGAGLLADVSPRVAKGLDWLELRGRAVLAACLRWWAQASMGARGAVVAGGLAVGGGVGYGVFRLVAGG